MYKLNKTTTIPSTNIVIQNIGNIRENTSIGIMHKKKDAVNPAKKETSSSFINKAVIVKAITIVIVVTAAQRTTTGSK